MRRACVLLAVVLLFGSAAEAQFSPELQRRMQRLNAKPSASWTETDFAEMENVTFAMVREMLYSELTAAERRRLAPVTIQSVDRDAGPPAWIEGDTVYVSRGAMTDLLFLGFLLGHDVYVAKGERFPIPSSLLLRPYAVSTLLPLLSPLDVASFYRMPQDLFKCPSQVTLCAEPQASASIIGTVGFVIAHELAHRLLGHGPGERSREHELAADAKAWQMLQAVAPPAEADDDESLEYRVRAVIQAAPKIVIRWLADRSEDDAARDELDERQIALDNMVTEDVSGTVGEVSDPAMILSRLRTVEITWSEVPEQLFINGAAVSPSDVKGKKLRLLADVRVFAVRGDAFAYGEVTSTRGPDSVTLTFSRPKPPATTSALKQMERERKWFELFLHTTDGDLRPRSSEVGRLFSQALARMKVGQLIDPSDSRLTAADRRMAQYRHDAAGALATWRAE